MPLTIPEIMEHLKRYDEVFLLEKLNIDSEMLVERFADLIENEYELLEEEISSEQDDYNAD